MLINLVGDAQSASAEPVNIFSEDTPAIVAPPIILRDGKSDVKIDLSTVDNSYCLVAKPFSDSSLVPGHCSVTLDRTTRAVQGNWDVLLGVPGKMAEVPLRREIIVEGIIRENKVYTII